MGDLEAQSTKSQIAQPWGYQLFSILLLVLLAMAALTVYVAIKNSQNSQKIDDLQNLYLSNHFGPEEVSTFPTADRKWFINVFLTRMTMK